MTDLGWTIEKLDRLQEILAPACKKQVETKQVKEPVSTREIIWTGLIILSILLPFYLIH